MSALNLDPKVIEEGIRVTGTAFSDTVIDVITDLARAVKDEKDNNAIMAQVFDGCITMQNSYNSGIKPSFEKVRTNMMKIDELAQAVQKMQLSEVSKADSGFDAGSVGEVL